MNTRNSRPIRRMNGAAQAFRGAGADSTPTNAGGTFGAAARAADPSPPPCSPGPWPMHLGPDHEPSSWLRELKAARVRQTTHLAATLAPTDVLVGTLTGRPTRDGSREDRTCDRCRTWVPYDGNLHMLVVQPTPQLLLVGGLCSGCLEREVGA